MSADQSLVKSASRRRSQRNESGHVNKKGKARLVRKRKAFEWDTSKKQIALLNSMINLKPAGINKHLNMLLIRENVSKTLKKKVPTGAIWNFVNDHWHINEADKIENIQIPTEKENFDLPKDEEWAKLIKEQTDIINKTKKDAINEDSINNVDVKTLKTVKIMVEKLDDQFMLNNLKSSNKLNDEETTDDDKLILQNECISSNVEGDIKRKLDNTIDLDPNYLQKEPNKDCLSADVMLMKRPRSTSVSPDNSLKIKMKRSNSFSCVLKCHSDNVKNNIKSNVVQKKKLTRTLSLSFLSLDATKQLSRSKTLGSKVFDELNNIIVTVEHGHSLSRNTYELRGRATSSKNISSSSETSDLKDLKGLKLNNVIPPLNFNSEKKLCKLRSRSNSSSYVSTRSTTPEYKNVEELKPRYITSDTSISKRKSLRSQPISSNESSSKVTPDQKEPETLKTNTVSVSKPALRAKCNNYKSNARSMSSENRIATQNIHSKSHRYKIKNCSTSSSSPRKLNLSTSSRSTISTRNSTKTSVKSTKYRLNQSVDCFKSFSKKILQTHEKSKKKTHNGDAKSVQFCVDGEISSIKTRSHDLRLILNSHDVSLKTDNVLPKVTFEQVKRTRSFTSGSSNIATSQ